MKVQVAVRISFCDVVEQDKYYAVSFESEAFRDALVPIDHYDDAAHPLFKILCTDGKCKRERTLCRDKLVKELTGHFAKCLQAYLAANDTLMGYAITDNSWQRH